MKSKITFNTKDLCAIYSISPPRLAQIRNGQKTKLNKNVTGKSVVYNREPILKKGEDWNLKNLQVVYYMSAIKKLNNQTKKGKSIQKNLGIDFEAFGSDSEIISVLLQYSNTDRKTKLELSSKFSEFLSPIVEDNSPKRNPQSIENSSGKNALKTYFKKIFNWFGGKPETPSTHNPIKEKKIKIKINKKEIILNEKDANEIIRIVESSSKYMDKV